MRNIVEVTNHILEHVPAHKLPFRLDLLRLVKSKWPYKAPEQIKECFGDLTMTVNRYIPYECDLNKLEPWQKNIILILIDSPEQPLRKPKEVPVTVVQKLSDALEAADLEFGIAENGSIGLVRQVTEALAAGEASLQAKCTEIQRLQNEAGQWADETFDTQKGPLPALHHLKKEVDELIKDPNDHTEYADALMLLLNAYRRIGGTADQLVANTFSKLAVCKKRKWGQPDANGVVEHVKE